MASDDLQRVNLHYAIASGLATLDDITPDPEPEPDPLEAEVRPATRHRKRKAPAED